VPVVPMGAPSLERIPRPRNLLREPVLPAGGGLVAALLGVPSGHSADARVAAALAWPR